MIDPKVLPTEQLERGRGGQAEQGSGLGRPQTAC